MRQQNVGDSKVGWEILIPNLNQDLSHCEARPSRVLEKSILLVWLQGTKKLVGIHYHFTHSTECTWDSLRWIMGYQSGFMSVPGRIVTKEGRLFYQSFSLGRRNWPRKLLVSTPRVPECFCSDVSSYHLTVSPGTGPRKSQGARHFTTD